MSRLNSRMSVKERRLRAALTNVLEYLWDAEASAWRAVPQRERRRHVFRSLRIIRQWLDERGQ